MQYLIVLLAVAGIVAIIAHFFQSKKGGDDAVVDNTTCDTCDGTINSCEQECMLRAAIEPIDYFDDEELDDFRGKEADDYTDDEAQQFRDVMLTMRQEELKDWSRSLSLRAINIPNQIRDELIMLIDDTIK